METNPYPQTTTVTPKNSGLAIASLVCGILGLCLIVPSLFGGIFGIIALIKINKSQGALKGSGFAIGGLITSGLAILILIPASMLLPALARAKAKANRIKCVNNLGSIGKSLTGFADMNGQRLPWRLLESQQANHQFNSPGVGAGSAAQVVNIAAMRSELQTPKILASPSDPERMAANEMLQANWKAASETDIAAGLSYVFAAPGGDVQRPSTVLALTRNIRSDLTSDWTGADESPVHPHAMAGLSKSQGQLVLADGSAKQSSNADLGMNGKITKAHVNSRGGQTRGNASTAVLR